MRDHTLNMQSKHLILVYTQNLFSFQLVTYCSQIRIEVTSFLDLDNTKGIGSQLQQRARHLNTRARHTHTKYDVSMKSSENKRRAAAAAHRVNPHTRHSFRRRFSLSSLPNYFFLCARCKRCTQMRSRSSSLHQLCRKREKEIGGFENNFATEREIEKNIHQEEEQQTRFWPLYISFHGA